MIKLVECVQLTKRTAQALDVYQVALIIDGNILRLVGSSQGVANLKGEGSFALDIVQAKRDSSLLSKIFEMTIEAQEMIQSAIALGYEPASTSIFNVEAITKMVSERAQLTITRELAQAFMSAATSAPAGSFDVEVIGIENGLLKVAKVLADFSYESVGHAQNDEQLPAKIGDIVRVAWLDDVLTLTRLVNA